MPAAKCRVAIYGPNTYLRIRYITNRIDVRGIGITLSE